MEEDAEVELTEHQELLLDFLESITVETAKAATDALMAWRRFFPREEDVEELRERLGPTGEVIGTHDHPSSGPDRRLPGGPGLPRAAVAALEPAPRGHRGGRGPAGRRRRPGDRGGGICERGSWTRTHLISARRLSDG